MQKIHSICLVSILVAMTITGCSPDTGGPGPRVWIDSPLDGSNADMAPLVVQSHAASAGGTAQVVLLVNDAQVSVDNSSDPAEDLAAFNQVWSPDAPGDYTLQVVATDHDGNQGRSNRVTVHIGAGPTSTPPADLTPPDAITSTPTATQPGEATFVLDRNANCRLGPSTEYEAEDSYLAGQTLVIEGRNDTGTWFWVRRPTGGHCWISTVTGAASGPFDAVQIVVAPPLPEPPSGPPAAPGNFSVATQVCSAETFTVALSWNDVAGEQGYRIYRDGGLIATIGANATFYSDVSPDYNAHSYRVEAFNADGANLSASKNSDGCLY